MLHKFPYIVNYQEIQLYIVCRPFQVSYVRYRSQQEGVKNTLTGNPYFRLFFSFCFPLLCGTKIGYLTDYIVRQCHIGQKRGNVREMNE
jgi:hypothetical protein